jgi:hypothetical protein
MTTRKTGCALLVTVASVLLHPTPTLAQSPAPPNVLGVYVGFFQSDDEPSLHPKFTMNVDHQRGSDFSGTLDIEMPNEILTFQFRGKLGAPGGVGVGVTGGGRAEGKAEFRGIWQILDNEAALLLFGARFTSPNGSVFKGVTHLLRPFHPDPFGPPEVVGTWRGGSSSDLDSRRTTLDVRITRQEGTSFEGIETAGGIIPCTIVGTIAPGGHFVYIGVSDQGRVLVGGQLLGDPPSESLNARYSRTFVIGAVDLGRFKAARELR